MALQFTKATKEQAKLRLAIFGPSGSGKTYSALRIATGMGGKIAFIDTERGSASKYADRFEFDVLELIPATIDRYIEAMKAANGYDVIIIDSLSHGWAELLHEVDQLARAKYRGNTWSAWSEGTPKQKALVDAILSFNGHVIAAMRTKTEWTTEKSNNGKSAPVRVGLAPEQGKGIEYEFDMLMEINPDHIAHVIKDRTGKYQDDLIEKPDEMLGKALIGWLSEGAEPEDPPTTHKKKPTERPFSPDVLKGMFDKKLADSTGQPASAGKRGATVGALNNLFTFGGTSKESATVMRHKLTNYLIGQPASAGFTDDECGVFLSWSQDEDATGAKVPHAMAIQEAAQIVAFVEAQQGQQQLMGDE